MLFVFLALITAVFVLGALTLPLDGAGAHITAVAGMYLFVGALIWLVCSDPPEKPPLRLVLLWYPAILFNRPEWVRNDKRWSR